MLFWEGLGGDVLKYTAGQKTKARRENKMQQTTKIVRPVNMILFSIKNGGNLYSQNTISEIGITAQMARIWTYLVIEAWSLSWKWKWTSYRCLSSYQYELTGPILVKAIHFEFPKG